MSSICPISACTSIQLYDRLSDFKMKATQISEKFAPHILCSVVSSFVTYCLVPVAWTVIAVPLVGIGAGVMTYYWFDKPLIYAPVSLPPGAPRGICNSSGANCWMNSLFQMIHADPIVKGWLLSADCPAELLAFQNFILAYDKAYAAGLPFVNANSQELRTCLALLMRQPGINFDGSRQEDPTEGWLVIHDRLPLQFKATLAQIRHYIASADQPPIPENLETRAALLPPTAHFSLSIVGANPTLVSLMEAYCNVGADGSDLLIEGHNYQKDRETIQFLTAPSSLWIDFKRYNEGGGDINIVLPDRYNLQLQDGSQATYQLISFAVHRGADNRGHYISVRRGPGDGYWYQISDSQVMAISVEQMEAQSRKAYFVHYARVQV